MDSGNSGSLQSSSGGGGGDDEYDSRADDSYSAFMTKALGQLSQPPQTAAVFSPLLSNYFDPTLQSPFADHNSVPLLNLDMPWSRPLRSDPCSAQIIPGLPSPGPGSSAGGLFNAAAAAQYLPSTAEPHGAGAGAGAGKEQSRVMRNPKKRSRASRRAPTTVLTTDTTNFRAMVQEFTGIPAPPFASSPFPRTRFDLFGGAPRSAGSGSQPPYLRRPFPQKIIHPPPFLQQLPSTSSFGVQHNSLLSSLLQSSPKYPRDSLEITTDNLKMDEFSTVNTALTGLPSLISPDQTAAGSRRSETGPACWGRPVTVNDDQLQAITADCSNNGFSSLNGDNNFPPASSNFDGDKAPESVPGRGEGMMTTEPWICSSDLK